MAETKLPGNWVDFLRDSMNKREPFACLISKVEEFNWPPAKAVYVTSGQAVVSVGRELFFCQKNLAMDKLPPAKDGT